MGGARYRLYMQKDGLNHRQYLFCLEYIKDYNGTQAAIRAGYAKNGADVHASRLLDDSRIQHEIAELEQDRLDRLRITGDKILKDILRIGKKAEDSADYSAALRAKDLLGRIDLWKQSQKGNIEAKAGDASIKITFEDDKGEQPDNGDMPS